MSRQPSLVRQVGGKNFFQRLIRDIQNPKKIHNFIKKTGAISKTANLLDSFGVPLAAKVARGAELAGYGKGKGLRYAGQHGNGGTKKKVGRPRKVGRPSNAVVKRRKQSGGSALSRLLRDVKNPAKINSFLKRSKAISRGSAYLSKHGVPHAATVSKISAQMGYGKRMNL